MLINKQVRIQYYSIHSCPRRVQVGRGSDVEGHIDVWADRPNDQVTCRVTWYSTKMKFISYELCYSAVFLGRGSLIAQSWRTMEFKLKGIRVAFSLPLSNTVRNHSLASKNRDTSLMRTPDIRKY